MRTLPSTFIGFSALILGCSTTSMNQTPNILQRLPVMEEVVPGKDLTSVDMYLERRLKDQPSEAMMWWTRYQQGKLWAKLQPETSCNHFLTLANLPTFPLNHVAMLRALEVCPKDRGSLPELEQVLKTTSEPWLQEILHRTILARAAAVGDLKMEMRLSTEVTRFARLQTEKVQLLSRALEIAKQLEMKDAAVDLQKKLASIAPRFRENPGPKEWLEVALDFRKVRDFEKARFYYRQVLENKAMNDADRYRALDGIRMAFKLEARDERYVAATEELAEFARQKFKLAPRNRFWVDKFHDSQTLLARTLWTERTVNDALKVLQRLEKELAGRHSMGEVRWLLSRIEEEAGRFESAIQILTKAMNENEPNRDLLEKMNWYRAWNLRKLGRHAEAVAALKQLSSNFHSITNLSRNRFWMAKSLKAMGQETEATTGFEALISEDPLGYYALISYRELGRDLPPARIPEQILAGAMMMTTPSTLSPAASVTTLQVSSQASSPLHTATHTPAARAPTSAFGKAEEQAYVEWLLSVGENQIARRFLDHYNSSRTKTSDSSSQRDLLRYHARAGNFQTLFSRLYQFPLEARQKFIDEDPSLLFPQPYSHFVADAGRRYGVGPELIYAIMRQESSFDPQARSHADAFGLMQLIPEAARRVEDTTGIALETPEDLYKPDINVTLGSAFLRNLLNEWSEQFILTVASYNASEKAIRGWLKTRWRGEALEFIEDIPYEETRGYVKLVMRNYAFYLRLNSGGAAIPFPEWCLQVVHDSNS